MFNRSLIEKYVGKSFEIDCYEIKVHHSQDNQHPLFKGPGIISGDYSGHLSFKLFNQIPITKNIFNFLKKVQEGDDPQSINVCLFAKDYNGINWNGDCPIPRANVFQLVQSQNCIVHGDFSQLATRVEKISGEQERDATELVFAGALNLPFSGAVHEKQYHGSEVISIQIWNDHHNLTLQDSSIML